MFFRKLINLTILSITVSAQFCSAVSYNLFQAIKTENEESLDNFTFNHRANLRQILNTPTRTGKTILNYIVSRGLETSLEWAMANGAELNFMEPFSGDSALHTIARTPQLPKNKIINMIDCLCMNGADLNIKNSNGQTPLHVAAMYANTFVLNALLNVSDSLKSNSMDERKLKLNAVDKYGNTALHYCAASGLIKFTKILLKAGANRNFPNNNGNVPISLAIKYGCKKTANLLISFSQE